MVRIEWQVGEPKISAASCSCFPVITADGIRNFDRGVSQDAPGRILHNAFDGSGRLRPTRCRTEKRDKPKNQEHNLAEIHLDFLLCPPWGMRCWSFWGRRRKW